jgi:peptide chain release factor 1
MNLSEKLNRLIERKEGLDEKLSRGHELPSEEFVKLSKERAEISDVADAALKLRKLKQEVDDLQILLQDPVLDAEMKTMTEEEIQELKKSIPLLEHEINVLLLPKDEADARNAIIEIRAGTGGEEAALFAMDLFYMYERYAELKGWKFEILQKTETDIGGIKDLSLSISGKDVFSRLKFESGVHRVQRVPETETQGRVHTSAATVAVLPEAEEVDIHIEEKDLRIDTYRASGAGGQHVNKTDSAVRITHLPTGVVVQQQDEKSQHKNRARALKILRARLYEAQREKIASERAKDRKQQIGSGDRSERIRTYNFPQGRVTDHRINLTLYKLDLVLQGEALDEIIEPLIAEHQAQLLAEAHE